MRWRPIQEEMRHKARLGGKNSLTFTAAPVFLFTLPAVLLAASVMLSACAAAGPMLRVHPAQGIENGKMRYDLTLFGGRYEDDLRSMAILSIRSTPYRILPYAPKFDYRVIKNLDASRAVKTAVSFLRGINPNYTGITENLILSPGGRPIGYEIRPLYLTIAYGIPDILETAYQVWGKPVKSKITVRAWVRVIPMVLRRQQGGEGPFERER